MLRAILNKSWKQYPTKKQLYGHLPSISKTIQIKRTRHVGHCSRNKDELISDVLLRAQNMDVPVLADQQELIYFSSVRRQEVVLKINRERWMVEMDGERQRESGKSDPVASLDDNM